MSGVNGAIIFTAPSGVGKSTQADLWHQYRGAEIINGDRAAIRAGESGYEVWGVPFSGSSKFCKNVRLPLKTIVCLSQAEKTSICLLNSITSFRLLWEGCGFYGAATERMSNCCDTILDLISKVPVFSLACTPDESAVIALENAMNQ